MPKPPADSTIRRVLEHLDGNQLDEHGLHLTSQCERDAGSTE